MRTALLISLLLVIAAIQILPQVDLPDTAFHEDSLPWAARCGVSSIHALAVVIPITDLRRETIVTGTVYRFVAAHPANEPLSTLFSTLLC